MLEGRLAAKGVVRGKRHLVVDVHSAAGNIDEDGSATVLFLRTFVATTRRESASNRRLVLINEDNLTRTKRVNRENIAAVWILSAVDRPSRSASLLCSLAGEAHGNRTGSAVGMARVKAGAGLGASVEVAGDVSVAIQLLDVCHVEVAEALVVE